MPIPVPTLLDVTKHLDPDGSISAIAEVLHQVNPILDDMSFIQGNLTTGHRTTIRTGFPEVYWRRLNQPVPVSKSNTAQVDEPTAQLEAWSEVDVDLASLEDNANAFRLSEATAFLEAMTQEMVSTFIYGDITTAPAEFSGLATRYSAIAAAPANAQNVISAPTPFVGAGNASIWLVVWGPNTVTGIYPKGSVGGLTHEDLGMTTVSGPGIGGAAAAAGVGGSRMRVFQDRFVQKAGLCVKDWRYAVRICNLNVAALIANGAARDEIIDLMIRAYHKIPNFAMGKPVFYVPSTILTMLDIQTREARAGNLGVMDVNGSPVLAFRDIPVKKLDALLETEAQVI